MAKMFNGKNFCPVARGDCSPRCAWKVETQRFINGEKTKVDVCAIRDIADSLSDIIDNSDENED